MITLEVYLMGRESQYPLTDEQKANALETVKRLSQLEEAYGQPLILTSGYRPPAINAQVLNSRHGDAHEKCLGVDLRDKEQALSKWCLDNLDKLEDIGFWMEAPQSAQNHTHLQTFAPLSGKRVFIA